MIKGLKKIALVGSLLLAGGIYTGGSFENNINQGKEDFKKLSNFLGKQSELHIALDLERKLKREKEELSKSFYISSDALNTYIKQAYNNVKKWPDEFDKRLFRLMLKQESGYNIRAVSKTGYVGLSQVGLSVLETFNPGKLETFKDSITGEIDTLSFRKYLFNPIINIELSLEYLDYISDFCKKRDSNWKQSDLETKRKKMLFCYNAGVGTAKDYNFDWTNENLPKENREYPEDIMDAYHNPKVKVKL